MTPQKDFSLNNTILEMFAKEGFEAINKAVTILMNAAMILERQQHLNAEQYERTEDRKGYANGFKSKTMQTRIGSIELAIPQTRDGGFYPQSIEKGSRSERALKLACAEMYIQGVSTRKVTKITEELCGFEISSTQVSMVCQQLDEELDKWRNRPLGAFPYLIVDARYEKVRHGGSVIDMAVLIAIGIDPEGRREVLGLSVFLSEAEVHWRTFLQSLQQRGLHGVTLITSDNHAGIRAALRTVFPSIPWQRCEFHLQQNAQKYIPKQDMKEEVAQNIQKIFNASDREEAERLLKVAIQKYTSTAPTLASWLESNLPEGFTVFSFPEEHRKKLRTSNMLERVNKEIKRRTRVATIFPNEASCLRLISAVLVEISEDWLTASKPYLSSS